MVKYEIFYCFIGADDVSGSDPGLAIIKLFANSAIILPRANHRYILPKIIFIIQIQDS